MFRPGARRPIPLKTSGQNAESSNSARCALRQAAPVGQPRKPSPESSLSVEAVTLYFAALYTKRSNKKRKTFQDGFVILRNDRAITLLNDTGKVIAKSASCKRIGGLKEGNTLEINSFEAEVLQPLEEIEFTSGRIFLANCPSDLQNNENIKSSASSLVTKDAATSETRSGQVMRSSLASSRCFKPLLNLAMRSKLRKSKPSLVPSPLHNPDAPNAFVIQNSFLHASGVWTSPIVMDPYLARHLRPHQQIGVKFLYNCVEGGNKSRDDSRGAVLADEMGLGKSLQTISLIWTMLKQGPLGKPVARKAIVICPASLVGNWMTEIRKWLGFERLKPVSVMSGVKGFASQESIASFVHGCVHRLLIISYEMFRNYAEDLYHSHCGIMICDEGHRLKSVHGNKTIDSLVKMPCRRRVILTGTPVQNDLEEFYAVCSFVSPGVLGSLATFRAIFANPILVSRDNNASDEMKRTGEARAQELNRISSTFVLRRTSKTLEQYLPPKTVTVVFCRLSSEQAHAYEETCEKGMSDLRQSGNVGAAFATITKLRKICGHPGLLQDCPKPSLAVQRDAVQKHSFRTSHSGKLEVAISICLTSLASGDKVVFVSNFTTCLDLVQGALQQQEISVLRLDGSTPANSRTDLVTKFNSGHFGLIVFLLSAKAGGVGLNLIGANRLILFDPDWNPATDLQTMARVWRDGQKKDVFVYRLLSTGTIEEKIFQRQLFKGELQVAIEDSLGSSESQSCGDRKGGNLYDKSFGKASNFNAEDLKDLFSYSGDVEYCETLEVLERSQLGAETSERSLSTTSCFKDSLLHKFTQHRLSREKQSRPKCRENQSDVPCERDDVLDEAINYSSGRGIVSYLYTKRTTDPIASFSCETDVTQRKTLNSDPLVFMQPDDSNRESTANENDKNSEEVKAPARKRARKIKLSQDSNEDDGGGGNIEESETQYLQGDVVNDVKANMDKVEGSGDAPTSELTWSRAIDELLTDF